MSGGLVAPFADEADPFDPENECKITQIFPDKSAFFALAFAPIFYRARETLIFSFRFDSTVFFLFISFECFYSAGVQGLLLKTIREFGCHASNVRWGACLLTRSF